MIVPKRVVVSILEEQLNLITDEDERMVHRASRLIEDNVREIKAATVGAEIDPHRVTLLSALRISLNAILRGQQLDVCQERIVRLTAAIDEVLQ